MHAHIGPWQQYCVNIESRSRIYEVIIMCLSQELRPTSPAKRNGYPLRALMIHLFFPTVRTSDDPTRRAVDSRISLLF